MSPQQPSDRPARQSDTRGTDRVDGKALARERLQARRRRIRQIRLRVAAMASTLFIAIFGVIFVQLVTGNDPALSAAASKSATTTVAVSQSTGTATDIAYVVSTTASSTATPASSTASTTSSATTTSSAASSSGASAVTTSQS